MIINTYGIVRMFQAFLSIKFENYVLLSGIIEVICFILFKTFKYNFLGLIIQFLQIIITLIISRRFLKLYLLLEKESSSRLYNIYFPILVILNLAFIIVLVMLTIIDFNDHSGSQRDEVIPYSHSIFSALVSVLLLLFGLKIGKIIEIAAKESDQNKNVDYYLEKDGDFNQGSQVNIIPDNNNNNNNINNVQGVPLLKQHNKSKETYLMTRKHQLYIIIISNVITDWFECILQSFELFVFPEEFSFSVATVPISITGYTIFVLQQISMLSSSLFNFIAFYFVVRDSYETQHKKKSIKLTVEVMNPDTQIKANANITDYLSNI